LSIPGGGDAPGGDLHLLLADSGLGGLAVCAGLERRLRASAGSQRLRLTYFNAAPEPPRGYNDLPDLAARSALLERTLSAMEALQPDRIVLACNTLSVLYGHTSHSGRGGSRVTGILEAGLQLFAGALSADPGGALLLLGTRTTIESGVHRRRLLDLGAASERIGAISCHGLARAIEADPAGPAVRRLIRGCASNLPALGLRGERLYAGLACTHYGFAAQALREALEEAAGLPVKLLNPNEALAEEVAAAVAGASRGGSAGHSVGGGRAGSRAGGPHISVRVLSKVPLEKASLQAIAGLLAAESDSTARALLSYTCQPDLF
jgi:glutamate racemase